MGTSFAFPPFSESSKHQFELSNINLDSDAFPEYRYPDASVLLDILDHSEAAIVVFRMFASRNWEYLYFSPGCQHLYDYSPEALLADNTLWLSHVHPEDRETLLESCYEGILSGQPFTLEFRFHHGQQDLRWIASHHSVRPEPEGQSWVVTAFNVDISDRKRAESDLEQRNQELRAMLQAFPDLVFRVRGDGTILECQSVSLSEEKQQDFYVSLADCLNQSFHALFPLETAQNIQAAIQLALQNQHISTVEYSLNINTHTHYYEARVVPLRANEVLIVARNITDQMEMSNQLRSSQQKYQTLFNILPMGITITDAEGVILEVNPATETLLGISREELVGRSCDSSPWQMLHPDSSIMPPAEYAGILALRENRTVADVEMGILRPDDTLRWLNVTATPIPLSNYGVAIVYEDITARQQYELALRSNEERLRLALEGAGMGSWDWNLVTGQVTCSESLETLLGFAPGTLVMIEQVRPLLHPADVERVEAAVQASIQQEVPYNIEFRFFKADGTQHWLASQGQVVRDQGGRPLRFVGVDVDITPRKQAEEALRQYERIVSAIPDAMALVAPDYTYQMVNQVYLDWHHRRREDILGQSAADLLGEAVFYTVTKPSLDRALRGEIVRYQDWLTFAEGTQRFVGATYAPYYDSAGQLAGVVVASRDLTDLKLAEVALQQQAAREAVLTTVTNTIQETFDIQSILDAAVLTILHFFQADRVLVYQITDQQQGRDQIRGIVVSEAVEGDWPSMQDVTIDEPCLGEEQRTQAYRRGKVQAIADIDAVPLASCYRELLQRYQVRANLVVPIVQEATLWGLLAIQQCDRPRHWQHADIDLLQQLSQKLSIAIRQAHLYQTLQVTNQQLEYLANHDALTRIPNRRYFMKHLGQEWKRAHRDQTVLTLVLCDVDHFKRYNDTYGHVMGDKCLAQVAAALQGAMQRPADLVARFGGEEFVMVLPNTTVTGAIAVVESIQQALHDRYLPHRTSLVSDRVTLSFGIASRCPQARDFAKTLLQAADEALYEAKQKGRDRYSLAP
ncbi:diguanylate cyclase domain-containing protein [Leptolyngbya sp. PCC 6406]|uniref:sensor domain-containing diguanylate cyclase n=1 Tax=Leptolyngbya sp. PCC 6406 TaxID=1173264 RepID=UPI00138B0EE1|nr:diguanylate cyclase [Leptolyngbya sp. PCC 6406]